MRYEESDFEKARDTYKDYSGSFLGNNPFSHVSNDRAGITKCIGTSVVYFGIGSENIVSSEDQKSLNILKTQMDVVGTTDVSFSRPLMANPAKKSARLSKLQFVCPE